MVLFSFREFGIMFPVGGENKRSVFLGEVVFTFHGEHGCGDLAAIMVLGAHLSRMGY